MVTRNTNNVIVVDCLDQHHVAIVALHNGSELPNLRCQVCNNVVLRVNYPITALLHLTREKLPVREVSFAKHLAAMEDSYQAEAELITDDMYVRLARIKE